MAEDAPPLPSLAPATFGNGWPPLKLMWDDTVHFQKIPKGWKCLWCDKEFKSVNHYKAMVHGSKVHDPNAHCSPCTAAIPPEYIKWYTDLYNRKRARKDALKKGKDAVHQDLVNTTEEMTATRMAAKANKRRNTSGLSPATSSVSQVTSSVREQSPLTCSTTHSVSSYVVDLLRMITGSNQPSQPWRPSPVLSQPKGSKVLYLNQMRHHVILPSL